MNTAFIYALNDPNRQHLGKTRYIGKAKDPYSRYEYHVTKGLKERNYKCNWIKSLLAIGQNPVLEIIDEVPEAEWQLWEREWIRLYRALGFELTNETDGGEGLCNPSAETRARMSAAKSGEKHPNFGKYHSSETRARMSAAQVGSKNHRFGKSHSIETRAKMSAARAGEKHPLFGKSHSPEAREKIRLARIGRVASIETREKMSIARLGKKRSEETRTKMRDAWARRKAAACGD